MEDREEVREGIGDPAKERTVVEPPEDDPEESLEEEDEELKETEDEDS